ncbi:MAG TPA: endonuclease domain-containing protein [Longimicrobium sp.]|nr:endonuclease domain-containing protein [Longimicrobium sp.]
MRRTIRGTSPELEQAAHTMRRQPTRAEEVLWGALQKKQAAGLKFRRQHPVGRFVLEFYCPSHGPVVEVDGGVHDEQVERDAERTRVLEAHGYRVLRFRNEQVTNELPSVVQEIAAAAEARATTPKPA